MISKVKQLGLLFICILMIAVIGMFGINYIRYQTICDFEYDITVDVQPKSDTYSKDDDLVFEVSIKNQGETNVNNLEVFIEKEGYVSSDGYTTVFHKDELLAGNLTSYLAGLRKSEDKVKLDFNGKSYSFQLKVLSFIVILFVVLMFLCLYKKKPKRDIVVLVLGVLICVGLGLYLKAKQRDGNILKTLVQEVEVNVDGKNEKFKVYTSFTKDNVNSFIDINNNDIPDCIEHNDFWTDTDGDGLSDYYELCLTGTSPLLVKTFATDLVDSNYDTDKDGLSNFYELKYGLEALNTDSDFDGLEDLAEVELGTDGLDWDTDKDGASDGWEVANGYDPLRKEELFENTAECFSKGSNTKNDMIARAKVKASGEVIESLDIEEYNTILVNDKIPGYIGSAFNFTLDGDFEEAEITFEFDKYNLGYKESDFVPCIYYFNEETQLLEELDCNVTGNCVTAKVEHFSVYILLNKVVVDEEIFADMFRHDLDSKDITIEFVLDRSQSMSETDPTGQTKEIVSDFVDKISVSDYNISGLGLVTFTSVGEVNQEITANVDKFKQRLFSLEIDDGFNELSGTNISAGLSVGIEQLKKSEQGKRYLILITDGQVQKSLDYNRLLKQLKDAGIVLYCLNFTYANESLLRFISLQTGGLYFETNSISNGSLIPLFDPICYEVISEDELNQDRLLDSYTRLICSGILRTGVGTQLYNQDDLDKLLGSSDVDGDGLLNGQEIEVVSFNGHYYIKVYSSPLSPDTDGDGIDDDADTAPLVKGLMNDIVGKLFIVACKKKAGHVWLIYQSYIKDEINLHNVQYGYSFRKETMSFEPNQNLFPYILQPESCISFGEVSGSVGGFMDKMSESDVVFFDNILPNSEYSNIQKDMTYYDGSSAYGAEITEDRLNWLKHYLDKDFVYTLLGENCTTFAIDGWNYAFRGNKTECFDKSKHIIIPRIFKKHIEGRAGYLANYEQIMWYKIYNWN